MHSAGKRFAIRRASSRDLKVLIHHRRKMWQEMGIHDVTALRKHDIAYRRWAMTRLRSGKLLGWVAEANHGVVGSACLWLQPIRPVPGVTGKTVPYLMSMYTEPSFRKRRIGTQILIKAIKWARKNGYSRIMLHASKMGRPLYLRYGFETTSEMALKLR